MCACRRRQLSMTPWVKKARGISELLMPQFRPGPQSVFAAAWCRERKQLQVRKGEVVVHPQHGPARVEAVETRKIGGASRRYLTLKIFSDDMSVALPADIAEEIGVRPVVDGDGVAEVFAVLTADSEAYDKVWSRRLKQNTERLRSGKIGTIAALIRDVTRRDDEKRVSYGEASLVREAMVLLREELAAALSISAEDAEDMTLTAVRERVRPGLPQETLAQAS